MRKATVYDVAASAGVSAASVSNYFHNPGKLSEGTRIRIADAVTSLEFVPNDGARALRLGRRPIIGYVSFELAAAHTPTIARAIEQRVAARDMHLLLANDDGSQAREHTYLQLFERQRVTGLIVAALGDIEPELAALRRRGIPSVLIGAAASSPEQPSVSNDDEEGGRLAVQHLVDTGRRRIAFVAGSLEIPQVRDRLRGALAAVQDANGVSLEVLPVAERTVAAGAAIARSVTGRAPHERPDALFLVNDLLAIGAVQTFVSDGVEIPEEIAVVGYDDIEFAASTIVPITSVRTPDSELGSAAADLLFDEIDRSSEPGAGARAERRIVFRPELVVRRSTVG